jgi:hypothetical protein
MFWREKKPSTRYPFSISKTLLIVGVVAVFFVVYRLIAAPDTIQNYLQETGKKWYSRVLSLIYPLDPAGTKAFSSLLTLLEEQVDKKTGEQLVNTILRPLQEKTWPLVEFLERFFPVHAALLHELSLLSEDIHSLLGMDAPQTYLVVLQNTAEKRPNGWFFGSFALVTFWRGKMTDMQISDSYHPAYNRPDAKIMWPERFDNFLPEREIYFIGANKVGFTYHDGPNIKTLYEKSYPGRQVRGVIFLRTDMFVRLLPDFAKQLWQWQYVNATVDLIRGEELRGKKELYLASLQDYLKENRFSLMKELWMQLPSILADQQINIYLEDVSGQMHTFLRKHGLTTRFEENTAYFWDSNIIFNKLDTFIQKKIVLYDTTGEELARWSGDITKLPHLAPGNLYTFAVSYTLEVPEAYHAYIRSMNEEYDILLGQREEHILGVHHEWATRGNVYFPPTFDIVSIQGDMSSERTFSTPFSQNAAYETYINTNQQTNTIRIQVLVE